MKRTTLLSLIIGLSFLNTAFSQTAVSSPKTLLWRISGHGLKNNSFLYGTMHVQDKRLFFFGDSLYHCLEQADGYAMEVDLHEVVDSMVQRMIEQKEQEMFNKGFSMGKNKTKTIDSLLKNVEKFNDKASRKQLIKLREERMNSVFKNKEMPTIMDAYLYYIAQRQGKWVGAVEDVQDQLPLLDELGKDIGREELLAPEKEMEVSAEKMIRIYLSQDLDKLEEYTVESIRGEAVDKMLLKRNRKMAERMDSMSHSRSMFFAVGAAHLPGDSGVISLLRKKGYSVTPVFSVQKVDPDKYASKLAGIPWVKVAGYDKTYSVEMPGKPSDMSLYNDMLKMQYYVDMATMNFFMTASSIVQKDVSLDKVVENMSTNSDANILSKKAITSHGLRGMETSFTTSGYYYKVQFLVSGKTMYMLMGGGQNREKLENDKDIDKFLKSVIVDTSHVFIPQKEWVSFGLPEKAFKLRIPAMPKENSLFEQRAKGSEWNFVVFDYLDPQTGIYYMMQIKDIRPGYFLIGDSAYFSFFKETMAKSVEQVTMDSMTTWQNFPAYFYGGIAQNGTITYRTLTVNRGNRVYTLFTGGGRDSATEILMAQFLQSFQLEPYQKTDWKRESLPGANFYSVMPGPLEIRKTAPLYGSSKDSTVQFYSYDANQAITYQVLKNALSPYYWAENDSVFFEAKDLAYKNQLDSVLSKKWIRNGHLSGTEWVFQMPDNNNRKIVRQLLNGDTLVQIISYIPLQYADDADHLRFFDEFRMINENPYRDMSANKAVILLGDLVSTDTVKRLAASEYLREAPFAKKDLPLLHAALLRDYADDSIWYTSTITKLKNIIKPMADSSTVEYIRDHYSQMSGPLEKRKLDLLQALSQQKSQYSYSVLKELLLKQTPTAANEPGLGYSITDSLKLTRQLFPEILGLTGNPIFAEKIISISGQLLDSGMIAVRMFDPFKINIYHTADTILQTLSKRKDKDDYYGYSYLPVVRLLRHFNEAGSNKLLTSYLGLEDLFLKKEAAIALLKNKQPVAPQQLDKIAANKDYRRDLYDEMIKLKAGTLFPRKYMTQASLSESDMSLYASDDETPGLTLLGSRTASFEGKMQKFYLYRIRFAGGDEDEDVGAPATEYLGVAGPYAIDALNLKTTNDASGIYYKENFDPKKMDSQFKEYLKGVTADKTDANEYN